MQERAASGGVIMSGRNDTHGKTAGPEAEDSDCGVQEETVPFSGSSLTMVEPSTAIAPITLKRLMGSFSR